MTNSVDVRRAAEALRERIPEVPTVMAVLGSGLGSVTDGVEDGVAVPFGEIPGYPSAGVAGHAGEYVFGRADGHTVLLQAGRFHAYEGHEMDVVVSPIRVAAELGVRSLVVTNASGGIQQGLEAGSIMLIEDHINMMGLNPLRGPVVPGEPRFPDMTQAYDQEYKRWAREIAETDGVQLHVGVYVAVAGPSYETPAEVRMLAGIGADAVGMSTVPEVIVARARGLRCVGLSMVTNQAAGLTPHPLSHQDVVESARRAGSTMSRLVLGLMRRIALANQDGGGRL